MSDIASSSKARKPRQERSAARMAKVVAAAAELLVEVGPEQLSIPAIAIAADVPRAAIYPFFPDKYALLSHLARAEMDSLLHTLQQSSSADSDSWRQRVDKLVTVAVDYYNSHPVASILLLRGTLGDGDHDAHKAKNRAISQLLRSHLEPLEALEPLPQAPDAAILAVEIAFACMQHGYQIDQRVSPPIAREATRAACAYLALWERGREQS
tara:strand:+ start:15467 stop:16099 length:633 start_codon:yes stop_codon:yes gene_type:complete